MPRIGPAEGRSRTSSSNARFNMNRTPFSRAENSSGRASATPLLSAPGPTTRLASSIWIGRERAAALGVGAARVLGRDGARAHVGPVAEHEEAHAAPGARHAAAGVRAVDPREADVVVHEELPRGGAVLGPGTHHLAFVVPIGAVAPAVDDRPVDQVGEQEIDAVVERFGGLERIDLDAPFGVARPRPVAALHRIAGAERHEGAALQHPCPRRRGSLRRRARWRRDRAREWRRSARRSRPPRRRHRTRSPSRWPPRRPRGPVRLRGAGIEQRRRTESGGARLDEVPPTDPALALAAMTVRRRPRFLRHASLPSSP